MYTTYNNLGTEAQMERVRRLWVHAIKGLSVDQLWTAVRCSPALPDSGISRHLVHRRAPRSQPPCPPSVCSRLPPGAHPSPLLLLVAVAMPWPQTRLLSLSFSRTRSVYNLCCTLGVTRNTDYKTRSCSFTYAYTIMNSGYIGHILSEGCRPGQPLRALRRHGHPRQPRANCRASPSRCD
jgi:hypothetical protein